MHRLISFCVLICLLIVAQFGPIAGQRAMASPAACEFSGPANTVKDADGNDVTIKDASRIVTLGGSVTETVFALGLGEKVIGVDTSSLFPAEVKKLPQVGYQRTLAAEGVLALKPTLILATQEAGPPPAIQQIKDSDIQTLILPADQTADGAKGKVCAIAKALGAEDKGKEILARIDAELAKASKLQESIKSKPKVMFIYARGAGAVSVAGTKNAANSMIALAGGVNVVTGYEGYKPLTAEAAVSAAPEVLMLLSGGLESVGGIEGLLQLPGLAQTPAGQNKRVVAMEDLYLLGFGPRTGSAVLDLTYLLHPELPRSLPVVLRLEEKFSTFTSVIEKAGQLDLLSGDAPHTIFAPTDEAFAAVPKETMDGLLRSSISLQSVLSYHYVKNAVSVADLLALDGKPLATVLGAPIMVTVKDGAVILNGKVKIVKADLKAANGVIHIIDAVMIPERPR
jgi:iron complex transport system substrate-binding protein